MKILAFDCATAACSAAAWVDGRIVAAERADLPRGQAETLLPMVERVRAAAGIAFTDFDRLAVTVGPGHFTGLRVGLAAARGLALATGRPLVGISTLAAVAAAVPAASRLVPDHGAATLLVALDSKRAEAYLQAFDRDDRALTPPEARRPEAYAATIAARTGVAAFIVAGDAAAAVIAALREHHLTAQPADAPPLPDAAAVADLAARAPLPTALPAPIYLHAVETTQPRASVSGPR